MNNHVRDNVIMFYGNKFGFKIFIKDEDLKCVLGASEWLSDSVMEFFFAFQNYLSLPPK